MLDKIINLLERLVVAMETIAKTPVAAVAVAAPTEDAKPSTEHNILDYDAIAAGENGDKVIRELCNQRGIDIPKGTRTTTLVNKLKTRDIADAATVNAGPPADQTAEKAAKEANALLGTDVILDVVPPEELDPFAVTDGGPTVYTQDEVRTTLQYWYSDLVGVPKTHAEYPTKVKNATPVLMELLAKYGQKNPASIPESVGIQIMNENPNLVKIYEERVKGEVA